MDVVSVIRIFILSTILVQLIGCSTSRTLPAPPQSEPIAINITDNELSGWSDLPSGAFRVPESQVIISGHQSNGLIGVFFGPLGVAVQSSIDSSRGGNATENAHNILKIKLTDEAKNLSKEFLSLPKFNKTFVDSSSLLSPTLDVRTAVILTFQNDSEAKPYVLLQANLIEPKTKKSVWKSRYIASSGPAKSLTESDGWLSENGQQLKNNISQNLRKAMEVMLNDVSSPYPRDDNKLIMVQGYYPYVRKKFQTVGYELYEDDNSIAYLPKLGDAIVFSGVNIMDKSLTSVQPAKPDDARFKIIE